MQFRLYFIVSSPASGSASASTQASAKPGGTFTILANSAFGQADPAQNYTLEEWQLLIDTHDGLTAFAKVGGVAGTKIVPDLVTSLPAPTNGGKTYTLQIRKGIKSSSGQTLKPSDFVTTFERQFTVPGPTSFTRTRRRCCPPSRCPTRGLARRADQRRRDRVTTSRSEDSRPLSRTTCG